MRRFAKLPNAIWFPVLFLPFVLFLHYSGIGAPLEYAGTWVVQHLQTPLVRTFGLPAQQRFANEGDVGTTTTNADTPRSAREEDLEQQLQNLIVDNAHLQTLVQEAKILEAERTFLNDRSLRVLHGRVTARSSEGLLQAIVINRGKQDGLIAGLPVITGNGILIGTLLRVEEASSVILLLTGHSSRINAMVQNEQRSPGIIQGSFNISLVMRYIPQSDPLLPHTNVVTSGNDPLIPEGLVIGTIEEITREPGALFQEATVRPLFETPELSIVSVILP